jgi:hypothetical protein
LCRSCFSASRSAKHASNTCACTHTHAHALSAHAHAHTHTHTSIHRAASQRTHARAHAPRARARRLRAGRACLQRGACPAGAPMQTFLASAPARTQRGSRAPCRTQCPPT